MINTRDSFVRNRLFALLLFGIVLLVIAVQQLIAIWTPKSSLTTFKGTVQNCNTYVTTVTSKSRYGYKSTSQLSELVLYLNEHRKKFALTENIEDKYINKNYEKIKAQLYASNSVTVWVKKTEVNYFEPEVFQIETDRGMVMDLETFRSEKRPLTVFLLTLGLASVGFSLYAFFPNFFNQKSTHTKPLPTTSALQNGG